MNVFYVLYSYAGGNNKRWRHLAGICKFFIFVATVQSIVDSFSVVVYFLFVCSETSSFIYTRKGIVNEKYNVTIFN